MRSILGVVVGVACLFVAGCNSGSPAIPDPIVQPPPPPSPPPPPPPASLARLEISNLVAFAEPQKGNAPYYWYYVTFRLTETTGASGAAIKDMTLGTADYVDSTAESCWGGPIPIRPGGTLDLDDAFWVGMSYCGLWTSGRGGASPVTVVVKFVDDVGAPGFVAATARPTP